MSTHHRCADCGCDVFTLEAPRATVEGHRIDTGIKLATCMNCGSQNRPVDYKPAEPPPLSDSSKQFFVDEVNRQRRARQEELKPLFYNQLLKEWGRKFEQYAKGTSDDDIYREEWERQREQDRRDWERGQF